MEEKTTKKQIIITILLLLGGAGFTAMSFCIYYLVKPLSDVTLALICIVDFIYAFYMACVLIRYTWKEVWLLKAIILLFGYIAAFIIVAAIFSAFNDAVEFFKSNFLSIVFYAFFTSPSMFIVIALFLLLLSGM